MSFQEWDNDSDYAHNEIGTCVRCGQDFDMWNQYGIEHTRCTACRRKEREAKLNPCMQDRHSSMGTDDVSPW